MIMESELDRAALYRKCCREHVVDKDFLDSVSLMQVLYHTNQYLGSFLAVLVTKEDEVYVLGEDGDDDFGLEDVTDDRVANLSKIDSLCGLKICQLAAGDEWFLALSKDGVVYAWGNNVVGQLGVDRSKTCVVHGPIVMAGDMTDLVIRQIECSSLSVALSEEGKVFMWGETISKRQPKVVKGLLTDQIIVKISCNWRSVFCLSTQGKVFAFLGNENGNLGIGNSDGKDHRPVLVKIPDVHKIQDISSGREHSLALTDKGILFAWGCNSHGELGDGSTKRRTSPIQIRLNNETSDLEVTRIWAEGSKSFAMLDNKESVYAWGKVDRNLDVLRPTKYDIAFPEPFNKLTSMLPSPKSLANDLLKSFDNQATSDFVIAVENKDIHVHKTILQLRSSYFENMFNGDWRETEAGKVVIEHHSYDVYYEFLRYLYCGELRSFALEQCIQLMELATMTLDDHLTDLCAKRIKRHLASDNLLKVFSVALVMEKKDLTDHCVRWTLEKKCLKKVVKSDAYGEIPPEHARDFVLKCALKGAFDTI